MCGIVGVVSRPPTRPIPRPDEVLGGLDAALRRPPVDTRCHRRAAPRRRPALRGVPGVLALADHHELTAAITARLDQLDAHADELEAALAATAAGADVDGLERASQELTALRDVLWALRRDRLRTARGRRRPRRSGRRLGRARRLPLDPAGAVGDRPHGGPGTATRPASTSSSGITTSPRTTTPSRRRWPSRSRGPALPVRHGPPRGRLPVDRVQGGGRDRRARRQHRRPAGRGAVRPSPAAGARAASGPSWRCSGHTRWASVGIISEPNAHPVDSDGGRAARRGRPGVHRGRAQRRRRQPRRPPCRRTGCASPARSPPTPR